MHQIIVGILHLNFSLAGCRSLKEKRSRIQPILHRLQREFNLSAAEVDHQDKWCTAGIACAVVSNNAVYCRQVLQEVVKFISDHFPDDEVTDFNIEII